MHQLQVHELTFGCPNLCPFHFGFVTQFTADNMRNFMGIQRLVFLLKNICLMG